MPACQRVLHRFDFPCGGFVEITVSRDIDAGLALEIIERSLQSVKAVAAQTDASRKAASGVIADAVMREREACAKWAEQVMSNGVVVLSAAEVGNAIRNRG